MIGLVSDGSALYYTFSTIAQCLAGAIALLGAFVLYRLETLHAEKANRSEAILAPLGGTDRREDANAAHARGDFASVLEISQVVITRPDPAIAYARRRLKAIGAHERSLMTWFWICLVLTLGTISFSIAALAVTPRLLRAEIAEETLGTGLSIFFACLGSYALLLRNALRSTSEHER